MIKHLVSIDDFDKNQIEDLLKSAENFEKNHRGNQLSDTVVASLFFEPSTRTRFSFESAVKYLGGEIIGFASGTTSSTSKGETLEDSIKVIEKYCDLIVMRHPEVGSAARAAAVSSVPIINAGDGANEHPTQTLLDLYTIQQTQGRLDNLEIGLAGDLKYGRTVHSIVKALKHYKVNYQMIAPEELQMPQEYLDIIEKSGGSFKMYSNFDAIEDLDILYMTRVQQERFEDPKRYEMLKGSLVLSKKNLESVKSNFKVLHPLPRVDEIGTDVDDHHAAYYFEQAQNGLYVRQALLCKLLEKSKP